ncbi:permease [Enterococcus sp. LJL120]
MFDFLPSSVLQMSTIFLSIVIEALPFVLLGCIISGALQVFLTPARVKRFLPKNKILSILFGSCMGFFFPSCECGIVPIVHQFVKKDVPVYTAFAFMLTAPIINPVVIFSTYIAFSNTWRYAILRMVGSFVVALVVGLWLAYLCKEQVLKTRLNEAFSQHHLSKIPETALAGANQVAANSKFTANGFSEAVLEDYGSEEKIVEDSHENEHHHHGSEKKGFLSQVGNVLVHAIDEFFDTGRYLMIGGLIASAMQTYLPTGAMLTLGSNTFLAILVMMVLAFTMSLCSEADAFIGSSLLSLFGSAPVVAFLVFGPMVDIKNLLMMKRYFSTKFILQLVAIITVTVLIYGLVI